MAKGSDIHRVENELVTCEPVTCNSPKENEI